MAFPAPAAANGNWSVVDVKTGEALSPRRYSTGLTQDEAVKSILAPFRRARRLGRQQDVFFVAGTGSGKSLVALNVAARVGGRALVVIPTVNLQDQYEEAAQSKRVLKPDGRALSVQSVKGKRRYACALDGGTAADPHVCMRSAKNKDMKWRKAAECPHWAPTMTRAGYDALLGKRADILLNDRVSDRVAEFLNALDDRARSYVGVEGEEFVHVGPRGCDYMDAHYAFAAADVVLLSNRKWQIETDLGRKPKVDLEVFDEADGFLDELFDEQRLTVEGLEQLLARVAYAAKVLSLPEADLADPTRFEANDPQPDGLPDPEAYFALQSLVRRLRTFSSPKEFDDDKTWRALESVPVMIGHWPKLARDRLRGEFQLHSWSGVHVENLMFSQAIQDDNENIIAKVKAFVESKESLILAYDATGVYFTYHNLSAPLARLTKSCAPLRLWMSATFPSESILKQVYGFRDPLIIQGEPRFQGTLRVVENAPPKITHATWQKAATRKAFVDALHDVFMRIPEGEQTIVVVHGKQRLIDVQDLSPIAAWMVREMEDDAERHEARLDEFFQGNRKVLASTRIVRGVDFAGEKARNIVLLKDPLPNLRAPRFQVFEKKWSPQLIYAYADDIASRTLAQMVGRGLRHEKDWARLWVLDSAIQPRIQRITADRARVERETPPPIMRTLEKVVKALPPHPPRPEEPQQKKRARRKRAAKK